jgi:hypothetical protein
MKYLLLLWLLFLLGGVLIIEERRRRTPPVPQPTVTVRMRDCSSRKDKGLNDYPRTTRAMQVNHRLLGRDLLWDAQAKTKPNPEQFVGKYLGCAIGAKEPVTQDDLRFAPEIESSSDQALYLISLSTQPALMQALNAGSTIDLWRDFNPLLKEVPVLAILCSDTLGTDCSAVLAVPIQEMKNLLGSDSKKLQVLIRRIQP